MKTIKKSLTILIVCFTGSFFFWLWAHAAFSGTLFLNHGAVDSRHLPEISLNQIEGRQYLPEYLIVELSGPVFESQKKIISSFGGEILTYIPLNSFVVRIGHPDILKKIKSVPFVRWVGIFKDDYRLSEALKITPLLDEDEIIQLLVELFPGEDAQPIIEKLKKRGVESTMISQNLFQVVGSRRSLNSLGNSLGHLKEIAWIEEDTEFEPLTTHFWADTSFSPHLSSKLSDYLFEELTDFATGTKLTGIQPLHALGLSGKDQLIAYADTGLDIGINDSTLHGDFIGKLFSAYGFRGAPWKDPWGHGTHVGGLLVGNGGLSSGKIRASAFDAKIIVQSLLINDKFYVPPTLGESVFLPAYHDGARIHSNSWGSKATSGQYNIYTRAVDQFIWDYPEMLVLFASGNTAGDYNKDGFVDEESLVIPGTAKNCLTVGASENLVKDGGIQVNWQWIGVKTERWHVDPVAGDLPSDHENGIAAFSSRGPTQDGRIKPDLVAPGTNILSTRTHVSGGKDLWGPYNNDYIWNGGTSMSTPLVASGASVVMEYFREKFQKTPSSALIKALLINGAIELYPGQFGDIDKKEIPKRRPNVQEGWGRVDVGRSCLETEKRKIVIYDETTGLSTAEEKNYFFEVIEPDEPPLAEPISVTLAYHDFPSALQTTKNLVNDLDLEITDVNGKKYFPNGLLVKDDTNNVEGIDLLPPFPSSFQVKVSAFNVPQGKDGKQPYALVVSGGIVEKKSPN